VYQDEQDHAKDRGSISNISNLLDEYRWELIPFFIKIIDITEVSIDARRDALCTVMSNEAHLLQKFASYIIHLLLRLTTQRARRASGVAF